MGAEAVAADQPEQPQGEQQKYHPAAAGDQAQGEGIAAPIAQGEQRAENQHGVAGPKAATQRDKPRPTSAIPAEKAVMPQPKAGGHRQQQAKHQPALRGVQGRLGGERGTPERGVGKEPRRKSQVARQLQPQK
ncbi:hypothetical protein [Pseudoramibacter faecis]|uniref:hypothetical protein n=1 Tax=Pseudoramibacter faecis TaxID=3108534 RepID=UPI002E7892F4|nr:hypothetical protein [Pseudoramibacter sp. HA2172]